MTVYPLLTPQEWRALFELESFAKPIPRPIRRRLEKRGLIWKDHDGTWRLPFSARGAMIEQAPRSQWSSPVSLVVTFDG